MESHYKELAKYLNLVKHHFFYFLFFSREDMDTRNLAPRGIWCP